LGHRAGLPRKGVQLRDCFLLPVCVEGAPQPVAHTPDGAEILGSRPVGRLVELEPAEQDVEPLDAVQPLGRLVERIPGVDEPDSQPDSVFFVRENHAIASLAV
jgi:hypothetical protein